MKITSLKLKNFRCFQDFEIDFHTNADSDGGLTVLVAKNGEGKTSILDAINIAWGTFIGATPETKGAGFKKSDATLIFSDELGEMTEAGRPELSAVFVGIPMANALQTFEDFPVTIKRNLTASETKATTTVKDARPLADYAKMLLARQAENDVWPVVAYYGDSRLWTAAKKKPRREEVSKALAKGRKDGYAGSTNPKSDYHEFNEWFNAVSFVFRIENLKRVEEPKAFDSIAFERSRTRYECVQSALRKALEPSGWNEIDCNGVGEIYAWNKERRQAVGISKLSAGVKIVIGLVADVAHRCCKLNPHLKENALAQTPGIVLIDEIDLHLHPAWQQRILPILQEIFPKIQFIVSTHSPQVVSSVPKECVRVIKESAVWLCDSQTRGVESQNILFEVFGTEAAPEEDDYVKLLKKYENMEALDEADSLEGQEIYSKLKAHFGEEYSLLKKIQIHKDFIARQKQRKGRNA
ncbi:MAG: AAA family ATPase [Thermoguttaceae bacterium]|nr:AAA family ATPase [Thermoguttaceae bacterium]